ncbi:large ribosomal subunit protein P1A [Trichomonascus vanleenenianus]|uniref:60S acidic ribosomal protein P1 n=1 Tax=Trichomonascus vanleenenianus TaxID=2268995 RepID=UPI003EC992FC
MSSEAAVSYASLILADAEIEITADKLQALTKAAGIEVEPIWANVFAKAVEGKNLKELLFSIGASAGPAAGAAPAAAGGAAPAAAEEKAEEEEESDEDMGMGLFD